MESIVRIAAAIYKKDTRSGSVAKALNRFMLEVSRTPILPWGVLLNRQTGVGGGYPTPIFFFFFPRF